MRTPSGDEEYDFDQIGGLLFHDIDSDIFAVDHQLCHSAGGGGKFYVLVLELPHDIPDGKAAAKIITGYAKAYAVPFEVSRDMPADLAPYMIE